MQRIYDPIEEKKALAVRLIENGYFDDAYTLILFETTFKISKEDF